MIVSPTCFEVYLSLQQGSVFETSDETTCPGTVGLKLNSGKKRSMSLWVEFITASNYLSAQKMRQKLKNLVEEVSEMTFNKYF